MKNLQLFLMMLTMTLSMPSYADIWDGHIQPTLEQGFDANGFLILGLGAAGVAGTQPYYDDHLRETWGNNRQMSKDQTKPGDFIGTGIPGVAIALTQLFVDTENGRAHAEALLWSFGTTSILKQANQRRRPNGLNRHSMPSGHSSTTFTTATALSYAYGWKVAIPAYMIASYAALTRVSDDAHWFSDVVAGATIGIFWGRATSFHHQTASTATLEPWFIEEGIGIKWVKRF